MPNEQIRDFLKEHPELKVTYFSQSTHTSELAAAALGVEAAQIAKSLVFIADLKPLLVVTCGDKKIDSRKLAKTLGAKKVRFADAETAEAATGFPPGGVSPVGLATEIPLYLDQSLWDYQTVYTAAGTANSALPLSPDRLQELTGASVIDVCK